MKEKSPPDYGIGTVEMETMHVDFLFIMLGIGGRSNGSIVS